MSNLKRISINASGKQAHPDNTNEKDDEIRFKIKELRGKIKMKERGQYSEKLRNEKIMRENDMAISEMRIENSQLRKTVRMALDIDQLMVNQALIERKRQRLALTGKTSEVAIKELDHTVCDLARKLNELSHTKKKYMDKITELEKKLYERTQNPEADPEISTIARQLENSINKVKLKSATAFRIQGVYHKIQKALGDELRTYPNELNKLEKKILEQRTELQTLRNIQKSASVERDEALENKTDLETAVREDRRERELTMRAIRNKVKNVTTMIELPHTRGKPTRYLEEEKRLAEMAKRTQERLEKIKEYQEKANMLEAVTGIPFSNKESIVNCFRNQKNSSRTLRAQTTKNRNALIKKKKLLSEYKSQYDKMIHEHEMELEKKISEAKKQVNRLELRKKELSNSQIITLELMEEVHAWLEPITTKLLRVCEKLHLKSAKALIWKAKECIRTGKDKQDIRKLFSIFTELLNTLNDEIRETGKTQTDFETVSNKEEDALLSESNNRVLSTLERKEEEDFDYNTPNNDEYLSRTSIKRQAESRQRGNRYDKL
uniref:coiled-coil domain-containing protein 183-like n=1 Tax=Styela clava TaxID=7725 RepID=UPI00193A5836|nr:coiled-coil domain-containing protein 183-like [Styela clava]